MRRDVLALASLATTQGIPLAIAPSVTPLLTEEMVLRAKEIGVRAMSVSLDGATADTHDGIRGVPGHHQQTLAAIEMLVRSGLTVQINTAVMRRNVEELAAIAELVSSLEAHIWEVFFLIKVGRGTEVEDITPKENEDVAHFLCDASRYGFTVRTVEAPFFRRVVASRRNVDEATDVAEHFSLGPLYTRLSTDLRRKLGEPLSQERAQTAGTRDGKGILFVAHDGEVYPSGFLPLSLGNVRNRSIVDIYRDHPTLRSIRRAEFGGRCGVCEHKDLCGGSRARAYAATGDSLAEDPACAYFPGEALTGPHRDVPTSDWGPFGPTVR